MTQASSLEFALIGLLKQKAQSGYDLRKAFTTTPMRHFSDSPGSIYPALRRLQTRKWISVSKDASGRKRQLFRVTQAGERAFLEWLQTPVTREDVIWRIDTVFIRFAFQGDNVPRNVSLRFLDQFEEQLVSYTRELRQYAEESGLACSSTTGALAFASGVEGYQSQLAWTRQARKKLMEASS